MAATESDKPGLVPFIINGADYVPETTFDVVSPATGKIAHQCGAASVADAAAARRDIFLRASAIFQQRHDELAQCISGETGAPPQWSAFNVKLAGELIKDIAGRVATIEGLFPALSDPNTSAIILREPYGVILAIAPWNAPYILGTRSVAFSVAAGNTVVLKASELAPRTMRIWILLRRVAPSGHWTIQARYACAPRGSLFIRLSRPHFRRSLRRIDKLYPASGAAPVLINDAAVKNNKALVDDAISKGATVIHGNIDAREISGNRLRPIVLDNVTPEMDIYETETFGPTVFLYEIGTEEEAIRIANDTEYGLTSAVFTDDLRRGLRFAREIETGAVHINNMTIHDESALPHGGAKSSGHGRFNSSAGLGEWVRTKTITFVN